MPFGCRKRFAHPLAPSARGLRPQAVRERTGRLPEVFRAMARFSPSAPSGHLPRRGRFFNTLRAHTVRLHFFCANNHPGKETVSLIWRANDVRPYICHQTPHSSRRPRRLQASPSGERDTALTSPAHLLAGALSIYKQYKYKKTVSPTLTVFWQG